MKKRKPLKIDWTHHREYFKIAQDNYHTIEKLRKEHDMLQAQLKGKRMSDDDVALLASKNDAIGELAIIVVIFCALAVEAYINHYGISRLSKNFFTRYLDRLEVLAKWVIVPRIVTGKQLNPGSASLQDLSWLISLRNRLVHYKSKQIEIEELREDDFLWDYDADKAIRTVRRVMHGLKRIDGNIDIAWLNA